MILAAAVGSISAAADSPSSPPPREAEVEANEGGGVIARVNGEAILAEDIERQLGRLHGSAQKGDRPGFDVDRLMFRLINDLLLGQEGRALGMDREEPIASRVEAYRRELAVKKLRQVEIDERARPNDEEVRKTFQEQYRRITLRVVTVYERDEAEEILSELRAGADIETLAKERSVDPYSLRGGLVSDLPRIDVLNEVADLAFTLEPGQIDGPVRTDIGWTVFRVESKRAADPARFEAVERKVRRLVRHRKGEELRASLAAEVRERHPASIDDDAVRAIQPKRLPDSRLAPDYDDPSAVVVRIGEDHWITAEDYGKALLKRWSSVRNEEAARASAPIILKRLIDERLLLAEALDRGYAELPRIARSIHTFETDLLVQRYLEEIVADGIEVGAEEMKTYYDANKEKFKMPPRLHVGQITVETLEEAERIAGLLRDGADLGWLARRHSIDRFRDSGGTRGWMSPQPGASEFNRRLLEAEAGDVLGPFGSSGHYVISKVLSRKESGSYPYEKVSGKVRDILFSRKFQETLDAFITKLRSRSEIEIDEEHLARLSIAGSVEEGSGVEPTHHGDTN
jgi:peptidyl-prolyl cis-trans isomerase C